ncbi:S1C family serine protease [Allosphingosinicella deserti]|uniref:S1C family serine protease n=1 Tax=Allosphingosinicella deserti TaxID=2116704 RepID=UPI0013048C6D|nr:serine protease [Sphingomonas deserti]
MKLGASIAFLLAASSVPADAAEWWWIGLNGAAPSRVVTYVDRETIARGKGDRVDIWALAIGEAALPNGQQHQATHYSFRCGSRAFATLDRIAYDAAGAVMPMMKIAPSAPAPVEKGSIGESILQVACGTPAGTEVKVEAPMPHAQAFLAGRGTRGHTPAAPDSASKDPGLSVGTGFFIGPAGHVLTSYHVIDGARRIGCRMPNGIVHDAAIARVSPANDLALLKVEARPARYLGFAPAGALHAGDRVFTIGYGAANYLGITEPRFTDGTVSALSGLGDENAYMQISVPVQPGNSGGPLVNEAGQVVGIIAAQAAVDAFLEAEGTLPQNVNWAVKVDYAAPLLPPLSTPAPAPARRSREQAIALARESICLVIADSGAE